MSPTNNMDIPFSLFVALIGWGSYPINITPLLISIVKLSQRTWQLQFFTHAKNAVFTHFLPAVHLVAVLMDLGLINSPFKAGKFNLLS